MRAIKFFTGLIILLTVSLNTFSQEVKKCSQVEATLEYLNKLSPEELDAFRVEQTEFENNYQQELQFDAQKSGAKNNTLVIPIVFHVLHENGVENISDEQIFDQVRILNEEFNLQRTYNNPTISQFENIQGNANIVFRLAQRDMNGDCTTGIDRIETPLTNNAGENSKLNPWSRRRYLNVWVVKTISGNAAGYTYLPSNFFPPFNRDGIIILHNYVGSIGTGNIQRSSTLTHEVGHWLNLLHPWGGSNTPGLQSNCDDDDFVQDTPNTIGWQTCNVNGQSCGSLDNVQNHMDYSYCSTMFTQGQATRMRTALNSSVADRNNLSTQANLALTGTDGLASNCVRVEFYGDRQSICAGETVNFFDPLDKGQTSWSWEFPGGTPSTSTERNPSVTYTSEGVFPVTLTISDQFNSRSRTRTEYISVVPMANMPFQEDFTSMTTFPSLFWYPTSNDNVYNWEVAGNAGYSFGKSAKLNNFEMSGGRVVELTSSAIDLRWHVNPIVTFKVAFAQKSSNNNDALRFRISNNCGETWVIRNAQQGANLASAPPTSIPFVPSSPNDWKTITVSNIPTTYLNEFFRLQFYFESDGGNNIYIDDINITSSTVSNNAIPEEGIGFKVYPNPIENTSKIQLDSDVRINEANIYITDLLGKRIAQVYQGSVIQGQSTFDLSQHLSGISAGVYVVNMELDGRRLSDKLIIK